MSARVYVDQVRGDDSNDGLSVLAPVKTHAKAKMLVDEGGEIFFLPQDYRGVMTCEPDTMDENTCEKKP